MPNYATCPNNLGGSIQRYLENRIEPGSFLRAVLENDLKESCARADNVNRHLLFEIVYWLYNEMPIGTWGSREVVADHLKGAS